MIIYSWKKILNCTEDVQDEPAQGWLSFAIVHDITESTFEEDLPKMIFICYKIMVICEKVDTLRGILEEPKLVINRGVDDLLKQRPYVGLKWEECKYKMMKHVRQ